VRKNQAIEISILSLESLIQATANKRANVALKVRIREGGGSPWISHDSHGKSTRCEDELLRNVATQISDHPPRLSLPSIRPLLRLFQCLSHSLNSLHVYILNPIEKPSINSPLLAYRGFLVLS
jgi:hypothetical protein